MSDLISRQAVLDWLNDEWDGMVISVFDGIRALPSAQPEPIRLWLDHELSKEEYERLKKDCAEQPIILLPKESAQQWIPCERELPSDNREVEATCKVRHLDGRAYEYTCHASYVHRYSIESTSYCNWEECDEYNEEEDKYYALPGWYERVHNWDDYSYCAIEDFVIAWRELTEPYGGEAEC